MPRQDVVSISVTNVGTRATIINNISMSVGRYRKKHHAIITVVKDNYSVGVPYAIADGQVAYWGIPIDAEESWFKDWCDGFIKSQDDIQTLRFHIHTNHGYALAIRPEDSFRKAVADALTEIEKPDTDNASQ